MPIVYLLHFDRPGSYGTHTIGIATSETTIDLTTAAVGRGGRGKIDLSAYHPIVADVWECARTHDAAILLAKFRKQGSRSRLCSICHPGNARGSGRGNWQRRQPCRTRDTDTDAPEGRI